MQATMTAFACVTAPMDHQVIELTPLWEEDTHFIHYRCLVINALLDNIESLVDNIDTPNKNHILDSVNLIKINLGEPKKMYDDSTFESICPVK